MTGNFQCILLLFSFCFIGPGPSSSFGIAGQAAKSGSLITLRTDVDLVIIEVIVLDRNGKPVPNLKKEDFQLYEDGKKQEILSLDEVKEESDIPSSEASPIIEDHLHRGKTVLIVFDDSTIAPENLKKSRDSAGRFVKEHMRSQDVFAVASVGLSMKILQSFTNDKERVLAAIGQPAGSSPFYSALMESLEKINHSMAHLRGQKSVLIYGQSIIPSPTNPGTGSASFYRPGTGSYRRTLDSAKKSNVIYYTVDPGGVYASSVEGRQLASNLAFWSLATESGGFSIHDTNNIDAELDKLGQQISNHYILGFQSNNPRHDNTFRKLEIRTDLKGVILRHRAGYMDRGSIDVLASSRHEKTLLTALASPASATQLPLVFRPMYFYDSGRLARVLVAARIRTEKMAFQKRGRQMGTDLRIMGVAYSEDGGMAARFSEIVPVNFEKEKEAEFRKGDLAYHNYFRLRPGKYRLKLAASDESGNLGSMEQVLDLPPLSERGLAGSSIVLAERTSNLPDLIQNLQAQMLDESDPLLYSGMQIEPSVQNRLPTNSAIPILFSVYNLPGRSDQWDLFAKAKLLDEKGKESALDPISLKKLLSPTENNGAVVALSLPFQDVAPGKYRLLVEITNASSKESAKLQTDLEFIQ